MVLKATIGFLFKLIAATNLLGDQEAFKPFSISFFSILVSNEILIGFYLYSLGYGKMG